MVSNSWKVPITASSFAFVEVWGSSIVGMVVEVKGHLFWCWGEEELVRKMRKTAERSLAAGGKGGIRKHEISFVYKKGNIVHYHSASS